MKEDNRFHKKKLAVIFLLVLLSVCLCIKEAGYASIIQGEIENCLQDEYGIDCEQKMVLTVPVSYGNPATLDIVTPSNGLEEVTRYEIIKDRPQIIYPLNYVHTVAYLPYEELICADTEGCVDAPDASEPTCGWTYQGSAKIQDSQGFCCGETAHCLRQGELFFHGYEIGRSKKFFEVDVTVTKGSSTQTFSVSPTDRIYSLPPLKAELIDGFSEEMGVPELDNYILYVPALPDTHPFVQDYQHNLLLVPREEVSFDGSECNKVGTSFHAFRSQGDQCNTLGPGDCLHNQLFHKHSSDLQKLIMDPNTETTYLVHGKKWFKGSMSFKTGMEKWLVYEPMSSENSLVSLTMDPGTIKVIETESQGVIVEAFVKTFSSMSRQGTMNVIIQNVGDLKADYIVTVTDCNMNILHAIPEQSRTLEPKEKAELTFDIHTAFNLDTTNECLVSLKSPSGKIYDSVNVIFDTKKHPTIYSSELLERNLETVGEPCEGQISCPVAAEIKPPIRPDGSSVFKAGRTIPIKLVLKDCNGNPLENASVKLIPISTPCSNQYNKFKYYKGTGKYVYYLRTKRYCTGSYEFGISVNDETVDGFKISFKLVHRYPKKHSKYQFRKP